VKRGEGEPALCERSTLDVRCKACEHGLMKRARGTQLSGGVAVALAAVGWYAGRRAARHLRLLGEAERRASAAAAERARADQTHQLLQITDAALAALPLDELLVEVLRRVLRWAWRGCGSAAAHRCAAWCAGASGGSRI
jgi:hypothetical protein